MKITRYTYASVVLAIMAFGAGLFFYTSSNQKQYAAQTSVYQSPRPIDTFSLITQDNKAFTKAQLEGRWSLVFLGYLSCPDVCPTTMSKLSRLLPKLNELAPTQVVFVSIDPNRDDVSAIKQYVNYFNDSIIGVTAPHKDLFPFVRNLGLMYSIPQDTNSDDYLLDHSASIALINPNADIVVMFKPKFVVGQVPTIDPDILLSDFRTLLD